MEALFYQTQDLDLPGNCLGAGGLSTRARDMRHSTLAIGTMSPFN